MITIKLTEREWDHVLLSMETMAQKQLTWVGELDEAGLPLYGHAKAASRWTRIAESIADQMIDADDLIRGTPREWWLCWEDYEETKARRYPGDFDEESVSNWNNYVKVREVL